MCIIGKIDRNIFKRFAENIRTDEVILTEERKNHIIKRRGREFYDTYVEKFAEIIWKPDYIFADKNNTVLVCREFQADGKVINIVLRLVVSNDPDGYKNSIITVIGENPKRFAQRLRNNIP